MRHLAPLAVLIPGLLMAATSRAQTPYPAPYPSATTATAPPASTQPGGMSAGGLAPPTPLPADPNRGGAMPSNTERLLENSERKDSGRGLEWFYFNAEGGFEFLGLQTFSSNGLTYASTTKTHDNGPMIGVGTGIRLMFLTIGARARLGMFEAYKVATINVEVGLHIPLGDLEPYVTLGGGYAFLGSMSSSNWGASDVSVRGYDIRGGFGLDYYLTPVFSLGGNLTGEMLGLSRPGVSASSLNQANNLSAAEKQAASANGSSVGAAMTISAVAGLHF